ncbi:MAG TPA: hypothetical protein VNJ03_00560, partial [Vicinamibacterales bacterium]|nr:hypothetical protein [Vicinamibacterales bacterium]
SLNKVKTTGAAIAEVVKANIDRRSERWVPVWSPAGDWILHVDDGAKLISPDGKTTRALRTGIATAYAFSSDGQTVYGIRPSGAGRAELFSMSVDGGLEKVIGALEPGLAPATVLSPSMRLSLGPDGKSVTVSKSTSSLWLAEGLAAVLRK